MTQTLGNITLTRLSETMVRATAASGATADLHVYATSGFAVRAGAEWIGREVTKRAGGVRKADQVLASVLVADTTASADDATDGGLDR